MFNVVNINKPKEDLHVMPYIKYLYHKVYKNFKIASNTGL